MEPFKSCGLKEHLDNLKCNFSPGSSLRIVCAGAKKKKNEINICFCESSPLKMMGTGSCELRCFFLLVNLKHNH